MPLSSSRVIAIHDLSGFGRSSLTTVIPILSSMSVQVCPVPTALLSTHTLFPDFSFVDATDSMRSFLQHWKSLNLQFDAVYSGFLGSPAQTEIVSEFIYTFAKSGSLVLVDPVMADNGKFYQGIYEKLVDAMRGPIGSAQIITPNYTEACFLLGIENSASPSPAQMQKQLRSLADMGPQKVIVTSVPEEGRNFAVYAFDRTADRVWKISNEFLPVSYPGTGDAFASVLLGSLLQGDSLPIALDRAEQFISLTIRQTFGYGNLPPRDGIVLERMLHVLQESSVTSRCHLLENL